MKRVGDKLREIAVESNDQSEIDLFARSAFNRYYYACFLEARQIAKLIIPKEKLNHKDLPEALRDRTKKRIKEVINRCLKKHLLDESDAKKYESRVTKNLFELYGLFKYAYEIRRVADYESETKIQCDRDLKLNECAISSASKWPGQVKRNCNEVREIWKKLGQI